MALENTTQTAAQTPPSATAVAAPQVIAPQTQGEDHPDLASMFTQAQAASQDTAPSQPDAATASAPSVPAGSTPTQVSALAAQAAQLGFQLPATASDAEIATALMGRYQQIAPMAQYAQALLPHADQINEFFASRGQAPAQPAAPQAPAEWSVDGHFQKHWDGPKLTSEMQFAINNGMVVRDPESGLMVPKPGMEMMVATLLQGLNHALNWRSEKARDFIEDPFRKTWSVLQDPIERLVEQKIQARLQAQSSQQDAVGAVNQFEQANTNWMYQAANNGGQLLTPKGQAFVRLAKQMGANYSGDPLMLLELCKAAVNGVAPEAAAQAAVVAAVQPIAAPVAATTPAQVSAQQKSSFLHNAIANAAHQPSGGANTVQSPTGPVSVSPGELESMFVNDFRATVAA
mgnify:CR=1 FL=1